MLQHVDTTTVVAFQRGCALAPIAATTGAALSRVSQKRAQRCIYRGISCAAGAQPGFWCLERSRCFWLRCGGGACPTITCCMRRHGTAHGLQIRVMMGSFIHFLQAIRGQREA